MLSPLSVIAAGSVPSCGLLTDVCSRWWRASKLNPPKEPAWTPPLNPKTVVGVTLKDRFLLPRGP